MVRSMWVVVAGAGLAFGAAPPASADPAPDPVIVAADPGSAAPAATPSSTPADGVSHLPNLGSLPPGTTEIAPEPRTLGYLRDLFHAVRTDDVTMKDALLLLAQRPLDSPTADMTPRGVLPPAPVEGAPETPSP